MYSCMFTAHCTELVCDKSCPILAETSYLLERNNINPDSFVFGKNEFDENEILKVLDRCKNSLCTYIVPKNSTSIRCADMITYCAICQNWKGSRLHCDVYNLRYSRYLEEIRNSWNGNSSEDLEYMRIWSDNAKVLVVSNFDYVNFGDFECQTLLNLIQSRQIKNLSTILVSPQLVNLMSSKGSVFLKPLKDIMKSSVVTVKS